MGNPGWGFDDLLPVFRRIEDNQAGGDEWRGTGGPVHVSDCTKVAQPLSWVYIKAAEQAGLAFNRDFNGATQEGVGIYQISTRNGRRMSAARAFLRPAMKRPNLRVEKDALVTRILFEGKRAIGVEYLKNGRTESVRAGREVIVSAGSVDGPQLLQLSGVGPADHLAALGIPVVLDNANVGRNMRDHVGINYTFRARRPTHEPDSWALVGQGLGRLAISAAAARAAFRSA